MKKHLVMAGVGLSLSATALTAQANTCPAGGSANTQAGATANVIRDACLQAVDLFQFVAPQLGLALAGGNATLGQGGTLGGLGHFAITVRGNAFNGDLPQVTDFPRPRTESNPPAQVLPSKKQYLGLPVVDAAIGVFKGIPLGLTNVGGIDLLVSATYVPKIGDETDDIQINPASSTKFGFGARVGLLQESLVVPGISATYFKRDLPSTTITGTSSNLDLKISDADVKTTAWRIVANKNFIIFGIAAGFGQDTYDQSTTVSGTVKNITTQVLGQTINLNNQPFGPVSLAQKVTRTNMFADLSVNLLIFKLVGEIGQVSGMTNSFQGAKVDDTRTYFSAGLRLGF
jgi:hypothetical protein